MDVIPISSKTASSLSDLNTLDNDQIGNNNDINYILILIIIMIGIICKYFLQHILAGKSSIEISDDVEDSLCAISSLLLEAARTKANGNQVYSILIEQGVTSTIAKIISELYHQHQDSIVEHLEKIGISHPTIVGMDWRLDYNVKSKHGGKVNSPNFLVCLRVKDGGLPRDIDWVASPEDMQDMLSKVKDAIKQVDRV